MAAGMRQKTDRTREFVAEKWELIAEACEKVAAL